MSEHFQCVLHYHTKFKPILNVFETEFTGYMTCGLIAEMTFSNCQFNVSLLFCKYDSATGFIDSALKVRNGINLLSKMVLSAWKEIRRFNGVPFSKHGLSLGFNGAFKFVQFK